MYLTLPPSPVYFGLMLSVWQLRGADAYPCTHSRGNQRQETGKTDSRVCVIMQFFPRIIRGRQHTVSRLRFGGFVYCLVYVKRTHILMYCSAFTVPCFAMLCFAMLYYCAMQCCATLCFALLCVPYGGVLSRVFSDLPCSHKLWRF